MSISISFAYSDTERTTLDDKVCEHLPQNSVQLASDFFELTMIPIHVNKWLRWREQICSMVLWLK